MPRPDFPTGGNNEEAQSWIRAVLLETAESQLSQEQIHPESLKFWKNCRVLVHYCDRKLCEDVWRGRSHGIGLLILEALDFHESLGLRR